MINLTTKYAGLTLRNPLIVSSSGLTDNIDKIRKLENAGAGAVVLKSLFEEQIKYEADNLKSHTDYPQAEDYLNYYVRNNSVDQYLKLIENARNSVSIPVIASINCVSDSEWIDFSKQIEKAGAHALELNVYVLPLGKDTPSRTYEDLYLKLAADIRKLIQIPVIFKLGQNFTNPVNLIDQLYNRGIHAVVLFNRFYSPDINIDEQKVVSADILSTPEEIRNSLRWVAIASHFVEKIDIAASTGIHDGKAIIKQLLAGAKAVQVCSVLYKKGLAYISEMLAQMEEWMIRNNLSSPDQFRGKMNYGNIKDPVVYERAQFMKYYSSQHRQI
jgi:dihydroorotate dehydrogenase (fumarate)